MSAEGCSVQGGAGVAPAGDKTPALLQLHPSPHGQEVFAHLAARKLSHKGAQGFS